MWSLWSLLLFPPVTICPCQQQRLWAVLALQISSGMRHRDVNCPDTGVRRQHVTSSLSFIISYSVNNIITNGWEVSLLILSSHQWPRRHLNIFQSNSQDIIETLLLWLLKRSIKKRSKCHTWQAHFSLFIYLIFDFFGRKVLDFLVAILSLSYVFECSSTINVQGSGPWVVEACWWAFYKSFHAFCRG